MWYIFLVILSIADEKWKCFLWLLNNNLSRATLFNILTVNFIFGSIHFYLPFLMNLSLISKWNVQCSFCFWNRKTSLQYIELEQLQFWLRIDIKHEFETLFDLIKDTKWQIIAFCHLKQRIHLVIKWNFREKKNNKSHSFLWVIPKTKTKTFWLWFLFRYKF